MEKLNQFKLFLLRRGKSTGTIEKHLGSLKTLQKEIDILNVNSVQSYILSSLEKGRSKAYLNVIIQAVRAWGEFSETDEYKQIKYFTIKEESDKGIMSEDEIKKLLAITPEEMQEYLQKKHDSVMDGKREIHKKLYNFKNTNHKITINKELFSKFTFLFECLANTGMRPKEMINVRASQIDFGAGVIRLNNITTKLREARTVAISDSLYNHLYDYVKVLPQDRLFPDWNQHQWKYQFNMRKDYLGIKRHKVTTYSLRHSWVTDLLDNEANLLTVSEMAGWKDINRAKTYYKNTIKSKVKAIKKLSLSQPFQSYDDRFKAYREEERKLRERYALTIDEEKKMLKDLINLP